MAVAITSIADSVLSMAPMHPGHRCPQRGSLTRRTLLSVPALAITLLLGACSASETTTPSTQPIETFSPTASVASFYHGPSPLPSAPPGTVIRTQLIKNVDGIPPETSSYRVLYHSTSLDGRDMTESGMILVPSQAPPPGGYPIVSWAHGTTGAADPCAPSILESNSMPYLSRFLSAGFIVAETDYDGLGTPGIHPYLVGQSEGRSVLDAARAARHLVGPQASNKVVLFGHSQGGHAALFAGQEAKSYSPELHVAGLVSVAPVGSLTDLVPATPPTTYVAGQPYAVLASIVWSQLYPDVQLSKVLTPAGESLRHLVDEKCIGDLIAATAGSSASQLFQPHWSQAPGMASAIARNSPGNAPIAVPILLVQGHQDEIVTPTSTNAIDERLCAQGDTVQYHIYLSHNHGSVTQEAEGDIVTWIRDRFAGGAPQSNCGTAPTAH